MEGGQGCDRRKAALTGVLSLPMRWEHAIMPFSMYASMMLSSQLIVTVADRVPNFDVGPSCRDSSVHDCLSMEKVARDKLASEWPRFTAQDKAMCAMEQKLAGPPSYVGWLTCLQINANARNVQANGVAESTTSGAGTGGETKPGTRGGKASGIHRRHARHRSASQ
jgi:hypothetical protein